MAGDDVGWPRRPAREPDGHPGRGPLRRGALAVARTDDSGRGCRPAGTGRAGHAGDERSQVAIANSPSTGWRQDRGRAGGRAARSADHAVEGGAGAPLDRQAPPVPTQAGAPGRAGARRATPQALRWTRPVDHTASRNAQISAVRRAGWRRSSRRERASSRRALGSCAARRWRRRMGAGGPSGGRSRGPARPCGPVPRRSAPPGPREPVQDGHHLLGLETERPDDLVERARGGPWHPPRPGGHEAQPARRSGWPSGSG